MWVNRTSSRMAIGALASLLLASMTFGQDALEGMQLGAPADCSTFGGPIEPNEGYFFQYDLLYWSASAPKTTLIGSNMPRTVYYGPHPLNAAFDPLDDTRARDEHPEHRRPQRRLQPLATGSNSATSRIAMAG